MPRIFIAIRFSDDFKQSLVRLQDSLKAKGVQGNYCPHQNLHMTLVFIGEHYDLPSIRKAVSEVKFEPFELSLSQLGSFPTKAGVIWCGMKDNKSILSIEQQLRKNLTMNGVTFKGQVFYPHISLVQHPNLLVTDIEIPEATMTVNQIYVMKSERVNGDLIYSEI